MSDKGPWNDPEILQMLQVIILDSALNYACNISV